MGETIEITYSEQNYRQVANYSQALLQSVLWLLLLLLHHHGPPSVEKIIEESRGFVCQSQSQSWSLPSS